MLDPTGLEEIQPHQAKVLGLCKVISQEYPHIIGRNFDISLSNSLSDRNLDRLTRELLFPPPADAIAYRGNRRWVQIYTKLPSNTVRTDAKMRFWETRRRGDAETRGVKSSYLGSAPITDNPSSNNRLRAGGVYLITGGLGDIGLVLARYLAQKVQAKLVLIGCSWFPPKSDRSSNDLDSEIRAKIAKIEEIEELGAEVLVIRADVASMQKAIALATEQFGQIHGVIHAAHCSTQPQPIPELNKSECDRQFRAKVTGLQVLESLFADKKLDFCVLMSSLSSFGCRCRCFARANTGELSKE